MSGGEHSAGKPDLDALRELAERVENPSAIIEALPAAPKPKNGPKPSTKMGRPAAIDWESARDEYVRADVNITLREIAEKYKVSEQAVQVHSTKEKWSWHRGEYLSQQRRSLAAERQHKLSKRAVVFDDRSLRVADNGLGLVMRRLNHLSRAMEAHEPQIEDMIQRIESGEIVKSSEFRSMVYFKELKELADAAARFQELGHKALGIDQLRVKISGDVENPVQINSETTVNITAEMGKASDTNRMAKLLEALNRAKLIPALSAQEEPLEAEVVEDVPVEVEDARSE